MQAKKKSIPVKKNIIKKKSIRYSMISRILLIQQNKEPSPLYRRLSSFKITKLQLGPLTILREGTALIECKPTNCHHFLVLDTHHLPNTKKY